MKIFYAVQATGNGHISRAMELLPYLSAYGQVDVFLSGSNATLPAALPVTLRSKGLSLFYQSTGKIDLLKTLAHMDPGHLIRYARKLPLREYDLVLNDFECITALACKWQGVPSVHFGHQASFYSPNTPRPTRKNKMGEYILRHYGSGVPVGLHFAPYDRHILPPVIKTEIWHAQPCRQGYTCVYLPSYTDQVLLPYLNAIPETRFHLFSRQTSTVITHQNCTIFPVSKEGFNEQLIHCDGIITNAGFETPAEAMHLNKKILAIPIGGQYEQQCNAAALAHLGVSVLQQIGPEFTREVRQWLNLPEPIYDHSFSKPTAAIVADMMHIAATEHAFIPQAHQLLFE